MADFNLSKADMGADGRGSRMSTAMDINPRWLVSGRARPVCLPACLPARFSNATGAGDHASSCCLSHACMGALLLPLLCPPVQAPEVITRWKDTGVLQAIPAAGEGLPALPARPPA